MKKYKLVEVKYFEPAKKKYAAEAECKIDSPFHHPNRFRYVNCWLEGDIGGISKVCPVGTEKRFKFREGKCSKFLGDFEAEITQEILKERMLEKDRFELAEEESNGFRHNNSE